MTLSRQSDVFVVWVLGHQAEYGSCLLAAFNTEHEALEYFALQLAVPSDPGDELICQKLVLGDPNIEPANISRHRVGFVA